MEGLLRAAQGLGQRQGWCSKDRGQWWWRGHGDGSREAKKETAFRAPQVPLPEDEDSFWTLVSLLPWRMGPSLRAGAQDVCIWALVTPF